MDFAAIRARLAESRGSEYWRSLEELVDSPEFREHLHREFPAQASEWADGFNRRNFLKLLGASFALAGLNACTRQPINEIVPYVKQPENLVPGKPLFFATAVERDGFATGLLVESHEGHPTKIEGNPGHPSSRGSAGIFEQAAILDLYDPDRSQTVLDAGNISTWNAFLSAINSALARQSPKQGAGVRLLTETVTSPTLAAQIRSLLEKFPRAQWCQYQPVSRDNIRAGSQMAFGEIVETHYQFDQAKVIVSLDSDFLFSHPDRLRYTRDFAKGRRVVDGAKTMNRLYVAESSPTITGSMADHRLPLSSAENENLARALSYAVLVNSVPASPGVHPAWINSVAKDLKANPGASIVIAGERQPPIVHAIVHEINHALGNIGKTVTYTEPAEARPINQLESLRQLVRDMEAGEVELLVILGGNPVYTAPADLGFAEKMARVKTCVQLGLELDETSAHCHWHIPQTHFLEAWSDTRAFDGTTSIVQPLIQPLYENHSVHEVMDAMIQQPVRADYDIVRDHWRRQAIWPDFEKSWRRAVHDGLIAGTKLPSKTVRLTRDIASANGTGNSTPVLEVTFHPDPSIWDGRFANNGWLQELPRPFSKLTWDNAALISPALAEKHALSNGEVVELRLKGRSVRAAVLIQPGQAENSVALHLGYGRTRVGHVGTGTGFNAYELRASDGLWFGGGLEISRTGETYLLATTQHQHQVEGRDILFTGTLAEFQSNPQFVDKKIEAEGAEKPGREDTLYNPKEHDYAGYRWGMAIDLNTCIGCNACAMACQSENNIPIVGKEEVQRGRNMLWIRVDSYFRGSLENPEVNHMPVPCMHCENAPCELVCPVGATVHDHEGLNLMVYNRCVGTRYCSNNCPYKVRRFNFLQYVDFRTPSLKPMRNPNVSVRSRGVMEKCTYCIQRISAARITSEEQNRPIKDGEIVTACQQACPAQAIVFGDVGDPESRVSRLKAQPLDYKMLGELNTRPRTTYAAKMRNPNPELERPA
jgi:molybdopterin-containing oxidoreductase family iron-sulfur binding subunit